MKPSPTPWRAEDTPGLPAIVDANGQRVLMLTGSGRNLRQALSNRELILRAVNALKESP